MKQIITIIITIVMASTSWANSATDYCAYNASPQRQYKATNVIAAEKALSVAQKQLKSLEKEYEGSRECNKCQDVVEGALESVVGLENIKHYTDHLSGGNNCSIKTSSNQELYNYYAALNDWELIEDINPSVSFDPDRMVAAIGDSDARPSCNPRVDPSCKKEGRPARGDKVEKKKEAERKPAKKEKEKPVLKKKKTESDPAGEMNCFAVEGVRNDPCSHYRLKDLTPAQHKSLTPAQRNKRVQDVKNANAKYAQCWKKRGGGKATAPKTQQKTNNSNCVKYKTVSEAQTRGKTKAARQKLYEQANQRYQQCLKGRTVTQQPKPVQQQQSSQSQDSSGDGELVGGDSNNGGSGAVVVQQPDKAPGKPTCDFAGARYTVKKAVCDEAYGKGDLTRREYRQCGTCIGVQNRYGKCLRKQENVYQQILDLEDRVEDLKDDLRAAEESPSSTTECVDCMKDDRSTFDKYGLVGLHGLGVLGLSLYAKNKTKKSYENYNNVIVPNNDKKGYSNTYMKDQSGSAFAQMMIGGIPSVINTGLASGAFGCAGSSIYGGGAGGAGSVFGSSGNGSVLGGSGNGSFSTGGGGGLGSILASILGGGATPGFNGNAQFNMNGGNNGNYPRFDANGNIIMNGQNGYGQNGMSQAQMQASIQQQQQAAAQAAANAKAQAEALQRQQAQLSAYANYQSSRASLTNDYYLSMQALGPQPNVGSFGANGQGQFGVNGSGSIFGGGSGVYSTAPTVFQGGVSLNGFLRAGTGANANFGVQGVPYRNNNLPQTATPPINPNTQVPTSTQSGSAGGRL